MRHFADPHDVVPGCHAFEAPGVSAPTHHVVAPFLLGDALVAVRADLGLLFREQFCRGFFPLQALELGLVHVELVACLSRVPWEFVRCAGLEPAGVADHHWVGVCVALAFVAVAA